MGMEKATMPFGSETMFARIARFCGESFSEVVVAAGSTPPSWLEGRYVLDQGRGPLDGILAGLHRVSPERFCFVTACDTPLLQTAFVDLLFERAKDVRGAVPTANGHIFATCAVYSPALAPEIEGLLASGERRAAAIAGLPGVVMMQEDEMRAADPELLSLRGCNTLDEYEELLRIAGFPGPVEFLRRARVQAARRS